MHQTDNLRIVLKAILTELLETQKILTINKGQLDVFLRSEWLPLVTARPMIQDLYIQSSEALTLVQNANSMVATLKDTLDEAREATP